MATCFNTLEEHLVLPFLDILMNGATLGFHKADSCDTNVLKNHVLMFKQASTLQHYVFFKHYERHSIFSFHEYMTSMLAFPFLATVVA